MKKEIKFILIFVISMFLFIGNVRAEEVSISCPKTAMVGETFTCTITTDQTIYISSELRVYKGSTTMSKNGNIEFKASEPKEYDIGIISEDGSNTFDTATVNVKPVTTSKSTTTTTTTTTTTKAKSGNNYLSSITVNGKKIDEFSKSNSKYFVEVENDINKVKIQADAEDDTAKVEVEGPKSLEVGDNEYTISVTSENDTTKFYKVIVTRKDEKESSNTDIKNIKIKGYRLNFDKNSKTFYLNIDKEDTELDIDVTTKDKNANYEIEGNEELKNGSVIKIVVTAEDDSTATYRIIIEKKESNFLPIVLVVILFIVIAGAVIFIVVRNKKNKNNTKEKINDDKKIVNKENSDNEKTIEIPIINSDDKENEDNNETKYEEEDEVIPVDNDEEEPTRMLSYAEREELARTRILTDDEDLKSKIDEELDKTLLFDSKINNEDDEY